MTTVVRSSRVVLPDGERPAAIVIEDGRIAAVVPPGREPAGVARDDHGEAVIMPGLVDSHVHVNEPGRTEWEGFATATAAAAAGGVTTIVDMPLNSIPPTVSVAALEEKRAAARGQCHVDVAFWGGVVPGNDADRAPLAEAGVCGFKAFLIDSGVPEFPPVEPDTVEAALTTLARLGLPLIVHAELAGPMAAAQQRFAGLAPEQRRAYKAYLASRPEEGEVAAVVEVARLAAATGGAVHVLHLSAAGALAELRRAHAEGVRITAETCPHYLAFSAEDVPDGATAFKCAPPIRDAANRERLWAGLEAGTISMIVSDHSPAPAEVKSLGTGDFGTAWGGISSLQLRLPAVWEQARRRGDGLGDLARWLASAPADLAGLAGRKGAIVAGADADLVVWDPDASFTVEAGDLRHRHPVTPYAGTRLHGMVLATYVRGEKVYEGGRLQGERVGRLLRR